MALDVYFKEDIRAAILAGVVLTLQANEERNTDFVRGAVMAFQHQAQAFGIGWMPLLAEARQALSGDSLAFVLDAIRLVELGA